MVKLHEAEGEFGFEAGDAERGVIEFDFFLEGAMRGVIAAEDFATDFTRDFGEDAVDRERFIKMMRDYAEFANFELNWDEIKKTGTADLVNFCCMVSPYGAAEKQVLLEANSLEDRAETLIALAEFEMAKGDNAAAQLN